MAEQEQKRAEQHTPGPWITVGAVGGVDVETLGGLTICLPLNADGAFEANARLIAAAPELLTALIDLHAVAQVGRDEDCFAIANAAAAIAMATGSAR